MGDDYESSCFCTGQFVPVLPRRNQWKWLQWLLWVMRIKLNKRWWLVMVMVLRIMNIPDPDRRYQIVFAELGSYTTLSCIWRKSRKLDIPRRLQLILFLVCHSSSHLHFFRLHSNDRFFCVLHHQVKPLSQQKKENVTLLSIIHAVSYRITLSFLTTF